MTKDKQTIADELIDNARTGILMTKSDIKCFYKLVEHEYEDILVLMGKPASRNTEKLKNYSHVYAWVGTVVGGLSDVFQREMFDKYLVRVQYLEELKVKLNIRSLGFRHDVFFAVHDADIARFELCRKELKITHLSELTDISLYPARVLKY